MGKIKPMQVGYLYTNGEKNRQRNEIWMIEYCTSAEMATLRWKIKQLMAAESGEGLWGLVDDVMETRWSAAPNGYARSG